MATKEKLKTRAARVKEEMQETGRVVLRAPALVRFAECAIRFLLGAMLSGAEIFGGYAPFGLGLVAASGSGLDGFCALLGACLGYLSFQGFAEGLRYVAACILVFSLSFAFYDIKLCRRAWFMPAAAAAMDGITGFVYLSDRGWSPESLIFFGTELLLCGAAVYFYRIAFTPWKEDEGAGMNTRQTVSLLILVGTLLLTLAKITLWGDLSVGRFAAALCVMVTAYKGGFSVGATVGVVAGLGMDLAAGGMPFYSMAYAFSGVMAGVFHRQGKLLCAITYVCCNALTVLWTWESGFPLSILYEVFAASVVFMLLPDKVLRRVGAMVTREERHGTSDRARSYVRARLDAAAGAFQGLYDTLRASVGRTPPNDNDVSAIFDRTADKVCKTCALQSACWQRDYVSTFNALNDALPTMMERGRGEGGDYPAYFANRCLKFPAFISAANEELTALLYRRQYHSRLRENRAAVCEQYGDLARVLGAAAAELGADLTPDPVRERRLRQYLTAQGMECTCAAYYDEAGRLRVELEGGSLSNLRKPESVDKLSSILGLGLRAVENSSRNTLTLVQREPMKAVVGVAARRKDGEQVSGDTGAWFKNSDGSLYVLLCDGMGSGAGASRDSSLAVRLLEDFLRSGIRPDAALKTVSGALALRGEEEGGFTTIDLLRVDLFTGQAELYKYGAAPTYVRTASGVARAAGTSLPAGLATGEGAAPDVTELQLSAGDCILLVSDGVQGSDSDLWIREKLSAFHGESPKDLAQELIAESWERGAASDDRTALVVRLSADK